MDSSKECAEARLRLLEESVEKLKFELGKHMGEPGFYRVEATVKGSRRIPGYSRRVYIIADENDGFYTKDDNILPCIAYHKNELCIRIAFAELKEGRQFIRDVKDIVSPGSGYNIEVKATFSKDENSYGPDCVISGDDYPKNFL